MAKTRSQTGNVTIKKEEEDCKSTLNLDCATTTTRNKISKKKSSKSQNTLVPAQQVKVEENTDIKLLLKSIPNPLKLPKGHSISQEQINQLIDYVVNHGMSVTKASRMAKVSIGTGLRYYNEYRNDPEKKIPSPRNRYVQAERMYTQEGIGNLIKYVVDDKMSIRKASAEANLSYRSGRYYYNRYLKDPAHNLPIPRL